MEFAWYSLFKTIAQTGSEKFCTEKTDEKFPDKSFNMFIKICQILNR